MGREPIDEGPGKVYNGPGVLNGIDLLPSAGHGVEKIVLRGDEILHRAGKRLQGPTPFHLKRQEDIGNLLRCVCPVLQDDQHIDIALLGHGAPGHAAKQIDLCHPPPDGAGQEGFLQPLDVLPIPLNQIHCQLSPAKGRDGLGHALDLLLRKLRIEGERQDLLSGPLGLREVPLSIAKPFKDRLKMKGDRIVDPRLDP